MSVHLSVVSADGTSLADLDCAHEAVERLTADITQLRAGYDSALAAAVERAAKLERRAIAAESLAAQQGLAAERAGGALYEARAQAEEGRVEASRMKESAETLQTKAR